jgi:hypothetical protein
LVTIVVVVGGRCRLVSRCGLGSESVGVSSTFEADSFRVGCKRFVTGYQAGVGPQKGYHSGFESDTTPKDACCLEYQGVEPRVELEVRLGGVVRERAGCQGQ